jgi:hypothetical protein
VLRTKRLAIPTLDVGWAKPATAARWQPVVPELRMAAGLSHTGT